MVVEKPVWPMELYQAIPGVTPMASEPEGEPVRMLVHMMVRDGGTNIFCIADAPNRDVGDIRTMS